MTTTTAQATQVYQVFIKATAEQIWEALTKREFTERYFHGSRIEITAERRFSLGPDGSVRGDSPTYEYDPPRRLVHGWRSLYDSEAVAGAGWMMVLSGLKTLLETGQPLAETGEEEA
jgi:uncharacterized protein YndB with AHSA1/START domain